MCDSAPVFCVQVNVSASALASCVLSKGPDSSMILCWLMCISGITWDVRCWCTR